MINDMYTRMYEMELKRKDSKKEAENLYRLHLQAERKAYLKSIKKKRLKAEMYLILRERFEKLMGIYEDKENKRKEKRKYRRVRQKV